MGKKHDLEKVLEEGDRLFRCQGYHNTGVEEILSNTDFPRSSFYYHFKSKEGYGIKTVAYYGEKILALMDHHYNDPKVESPLQRLKNHFFYIADYAIEDKFASLCLVQRFSMDVGSDMPGIQSATRNQFIKWMKATIRCLEEAQSKGEVKTAIPAEKIARMIFSTMYGEFTLSRLDQKNNRFREALEFVFDLVKV